MQGVGLLATGLVTWKVVAIARQTLDDLKKKS
jgi:hypothetical protein